MAVKVLSEIDRGLRGTPSRGPKDGMVADARWWNDQLKMVRQVNQSALDKRSLSAPRRLQRGNYSE